jgi:hypothetical protein
VHVRTHACVGTHRCTPPPKVHPQPRTRPQSYGRGEQYTPTHTTQPHKPPPHPTIGGTLRHLGAILSAQLIRWGSVYQSRGESLLKRLKIASCTYTHIHTHARLDLCAHTHARTRQILGTKKAPQGGFKVAVAC